MIMMQELSRTQLKTKMEDSRAQRENQGGYRLRWTAGEGWREGDRENKRGRERVEE